MDVITVDCETGEVEARPATKGELAEIKTAQADGLTFARVTRQATIEALLSSTDGWAARAFEDGAPMSAGRVAYRQALRAAHAAIGSASDVAAIEAIELPDPVA